jgi:hypothetical protein
MKRVALLAAVGAIVIAIPAAAKPTPGSHPAKSHKCTPHKVAFVASGTLGTWSLTKDSNGKTYSGTITVSIAKANHHAKDYKGIATTFTVAGAHVKLGKGVTDPPAVGSKVKLIGKVTMLAKKCDASSFTPTITIKRIVVHAAKTA